MKLAISLNFFLLLLCACTNKKQTSDPNSAILAIRNDDGTINKEHLHLEQNDLILNYLNDAYAQITILTESPGDTLGDTSAANKLLKSIAEEALARKKSYNYFWIIRSKGLRFSGLSLIPKNVPTLIIDDWAALRKPKLKDLLSSSNLFLSFPTFHYLNTADVDFLNTFSAQYLRCTEYDFMGLNDISHPHLPILKTGFCPSCLGIFIEKPNPSIGTIDSIAAADIHLKHFLEKIDMHQDEADQKSLYFGYFNKEFRNELKDSWTNLVNFASIASLKAMLDSLNSDTPLNANIVVPASEKQFKEIKALLQSLSMSEHVQAQKLKGFLANTSINYYKLDRNRIYETPEVSSQHVIRIINPFPLEKSSMLGMLAASNPLAGITGDQSFSEGLQYGKIPFYQIMHWKKDLHMNFSTFLYENLGETSSLAKFFATAVNNEVRNINYLLQQAELVEQNQKKWAADMLKLRDQIYENKNLQKNLTSRILSILQP